ncbi:MAG: S-layer homology domain-containing protein [Oscillospiraceae bacterium]|nr:S-layer homology domain-containing protein [Oscillospiraceae bacterium]
MEKKALSLILALTLLLSIAPFAFAADAKGLGNFKKANAYDEGRFTDVAAGDWFAQNVIAAYELGLVKGSSDVTFNPKGNITVAETIALASRLHNIYNGGDGKFEQGSPWYQVYVDYATEEKILRDTYRDLNAKISRANFAFVLANALPADALSAINDVPNGTLPDVADDYKADSIYLLYRAGVLTGNDEFGTFNPNSTITRAEVAAIVTRMADKSQRKVISLKKKSTVSAEIFCGALGYANTLFANTSGVKLSDALDETFNYGTTGASLLRAQAFSMVTEFEAARLFAVENGIKLSDADKKELETVKQQQFAAAGGKAEFFAMLAEQGVNEAFYNYLIESQMYYQKASGLFNDGGKYAVDTDGLSASISENCVRVKHILIQADPDDAEKKALAEQLLQKISRGEDFEKLLKEYGEDPGMTSNPGGYVIDSRGFTLDGGQMIQEFTDASVALKVGGVSAVVPTAYGFHIIKRYPIDKAFADSYVAENEAIFKDNALGNMLSEYIGSVVISNRAELEKIDLKSVFGK